MEIGLQLPQYGATATRDAVLAVARAAEAAGFNSVWVSDHVVFPLGAPADYPYSDRLPFTPEAGYLEAITQLAVVAGATTSIRVGTSVLILPMRNVLLTAKQLVTLDVLSGGRLLVAVAAGWWRAEFEALGADFDKRGQRFNEQLDALEELWTSGRSRREGDHVRYPLVEARPLPTQTGGPPLWIGGHGRQTWTRIARSRGAGWHGIGYEAGAIEVARAGIAEACSSTRRDPLSVNLSTATGLPTTSQKVLQRLKVLAGLGISQVVFIPRFTELGAILEAIERFGEEVRPELVRLDVY